MKLPKVSRYSQVVLLASPVHFVGALESDYFELSHAWPRGHKNGSGLDPYETGYQRYFTVAFQNKERPEDREKFVVLPDFSYVGNYFAVLLSIFFGKRFQNIGFLEANGSRCIPDFSSIKPCRRREALPFSSNARKDLAIELNLNAARRMLPLFELPFRAMDEDASIPENVDPVFTAGRFYLQGLDLFENEPELAYISFVNAGEVLVSALSFSGKELYDADTRKLLCDISRKSGAQTARTIKNRLLQIRRRFRAGLSKLVAPAFFEGHESKENWAALKADDFAVRMGAAYDLRSKFLHSGIPFEPWVVPIHALNAEIMLGRPAYGTTEWKNLISKIPTLVGLERVIRFSLLKFVHMRITPIHSSLDQWSPVKCE